MDRRDEGDGLAQNRCVDVDGEDDGEYTNFGLILMMFVMTTKVCALG